DASDAALEAVEAADEISLLSGLALAAELAVDAALDASDALDEASLAYEPASVALELAAELAADDAAELAA
ncbi:hypothetical protein, partial [Lacticaseibacillus pantheris]|uniref:hypothetical protein n=1 Tax=Lacticaseibacillus pantheris TaxID=171523 RepID=UPI00138F4735